MTHDLGALTVRVACDADVPGIVDVQRHAGRSTSAVFQRMTRAAIAEPTGLYVVAEAGGRIVGWAKTKLFPTVDGVAPAGHYLMGVAVDPTHRRRHVGSALVEARIDWIRDRSEAAHYFTGAGNAASLALHRAWGFAEVARAPSFRGIPFSEGEGVLLTARLD